MLTFGIDSILRNRAKMAREVEYLKESITEDVIDERTEAAESMYLKETPEELLEALELDAKMTTDDSYAESVEIDNILNADHDLTFEEMCGLEAMVDKI
jgi:hypothetical protein